MKFVTIKTIITSILFATPSAVFSADMLSAPPLNIKARMAAMRAEQPSRPVNEMLKQAYAMLKSGQYDDMINTVSDALELEATQQAEQREPFLSFSIKEANRQLSSKKPGHGEEFRQMLRDSSAAHAVLGDAFIKSLSGMTAPLPARQVKTSTSSLHLNYSSKFDLNDSVTLDVESQHEPGVCCYSVVFAHGDGTDIPPTSAEIIFNRVGQVVDLRETEHPDFRLSDHNIVVSRLPASAAKRVMHGKVRVSLDGRRLYANTYTMPPGMLGKKFYGGWYDISKSDAETLALLPRTTKTPNNK